MPLPSRWPPGATAPPYPTPAPDVTSVRSVMQKLCAQIGRYCNTSAPLKMYFSLGRRVNRESAILVSFRNARDLHLYELVRQPIQRSHLVKRRSRRRTELGPCISRYFDFYSKRKIQFSFSNSNGFYVTNYNHGDLSCCVVVASESLSFQFKISHFLNGIISSHCVHLMRNFYSHIVYGIIA